MTAALRDKAFKSEDPELVRRRPRGSFAWAIEALREGRRVTRLSWGEPRTWLLIEGPADGPLDREPSYPTRGHIMQHADGWNVPWTPTHADLLANDWTWGGLRAAFPPGTLWGNHTGVVLYFVAGDVGDLLDVERAQREHPFGYLGRGTLSLEEFLSGGIEDPDGLSGSLLLAEGVMPRALDESGEDFARRLADASETSDVWRTRIKSHHMLRGSR